MDFNTKFKRDYSNAEPSELFILGIVQQKYKEAYRSADSEGEVAFSDYDINVPTPNGTEIGIEVNQDTTSKRTGLIAIEYEYNGKRSGIAKSLSNFWALVFWDNQAYEWVYCIIETNYLLQKLRTCKQVGGGDYMASKMYLLPTTALLYDPTINCKPVPTELAEHCESVYKLGLANRVKKVPTYGGAY